MQQASRVLGFSRFPALGTTGRFPIISTLFVIGHSHWKTAITIWYIYSSELLIHSFGTAKYNACPAEPTRPFGVVVVVVVVDVI